ncbi:protein of unknown function DUF72 [Chthoniobacter flavus Ellin428]|uniref:DUF72 domain-containing protein n=1 Tax=Chthoniobacter flavus Ellin428 TaxID=497964 RepID=B4D330_9BACT|nr:DUF72 domain-containing protein [Chthoniobacter flavus]EDY19141.1 protein of unknown function DUF72 [Chthoniobacter flavus Ellin428]TCO87989.1 uncharacterized protein YecE (DUF72 family) [Chthoniobacter flavus]
MDKLANIKIGTCAWSYEDWRGVFYPEHLPATERLEFYARHLPAVEVDSTFYAAPAPQVAAHWAEETPPDFVFACKLTREITHERKLRDCAEPLREFVESLKPLDEKLWCVLVQLPPFFQPKRDEVALREFVRHLPAEVRFAIEFRHADWHHPRIAHLLSEYGVAWAWNDLTSLDHQQEGAFEFLPDTTDFLYVRLMGDLERKYAANGQRIHHYRELMWPRDASLESWAVRVRQAAAEHRRIFVAVSNHYEGFAPHSARRLGARLGFDFPSPQLESASESGPGEQQMDLL